MQIYFQLQNVWNGVLPTFAAQTINMISKLQDLQNHFPRDIATLSHFSRNDCKFMPHFRRIIQTRLEDETENTVANRALFVGFLHSFCWFPSLYSILPEPERARICRLHE